MNRITMKNLEFVTARINKIVGDNSFQLDGAYNGYRLERRTPSGGYEDILKTGYTTARNLYDAMFAFISGIKIGKQLKE
jgi:hypothetical protein